MIHRLLLGLLLTLITPLQAPAQVSVGVVRNNPDERLGESVAFLGDVDGDGFGDFLVGAPASNVGGSDIGAVHVRSGRDSSNIVTIRGQIPGERFGWSVAVIGDVHGDSRPEFVVGGWGWGGQLGAFGTGRVAVYGWVGGTTTVFPLWIEQGVQADEYFGWSVGGGGDFSGDGVPDVIVGAPFHDPDSSRVDAGRAIVLSGTDGSVLRHITGATAGHQLGAACTILGGPPRRRGTACVGAPRSAVGSVYFVGEGVFVRQFPAALPIASRFAGALANVGDLDGDGWDELAVGACKAGPPERPTGARGHVSVFSYRPGFLGGQLVWQAWGDADGDTFGRAVGGGGDFDGDGVRDVIVGAPSLDGNAPDFGSVRVLSGVDGRTLAVMHGREADSSLGMSVTLGDIDGGSGPAEAFGGAPIGEGYVQAWRSGSPPESWSRASPYGIIAPSVGWLGDVDHDGHDDFAIMTSRFGFEVLSGATQTVLSTIAARPGESFRYLRGAGDVDGDGRGDLMVFGVSGSGFLAAPLMLLFKDSGAEIYRRQSDLLLVEPIGDINGDGYADVLYHGLSAPMRIYSNGAQTLGPVLSPGFNLHAATALGDVDADGIDDFATSSRSFATSTSEVIIHSRTGAIRTLSSTNQPWGDAHAIAGVGDVDRDGTPDLLVGDPLDGANGHAYLYSGANGRLLRTWAGDVPGQGLGAIVAGVGDADADGYPDFILGHWTGNGFRLVSGRTGGRILAWGETGDGYSEYAFAPGGGDFDRDGIDDVLYSVIDSIGGSTSTALLDLRRPGGRFPIEDRLFAGCPGSAGGIARCDLRGRPALGTVYDYRLRGALPNTSAFLLLGAPTLLPLALFGTPDCTLHVAPWVTASTTTDALGFADSPLPVGNDPAFLGFSFDAQWAALDPLWNGLQMTFSDVQRVVVGELR